MRLLVAALVVVVIVVFYVVVNNDVFIDLVVVLVVITDHIILSRGGQKTKKLESELADCFFPLHCVSGVTKKNFSSLPFVYDPPLAPYIIQRKFKKIHVKIWIVSISKF